MLCGQEHHAGTVMGIIMLQNIQTCEETIPDECGWSRCPHTFGPIVYAF